MSREVAVSVPGKAILLGEHAAVYGHPALVTAVDLRLSVAARLTDLPGVTVRGSSAFRTGTLFRAEIDDLCRGTEPPGDRLVFLACGAALLHVDAHERAGLELTVASDIPPGSGLGSSAALAVAVAAAVFAALHVPTDASTIARVAREVETRQHGRPSGVDVEAVLRGGTLWCERAPSGALECTPLEGMSGSLSALELYHAGTPAESTGEMVASVARRLAEQPERARGAMQEICAATREARDLLVPGAGTDVGSRLRLLLARAEAALESLQVVPEATARAIREIEAGGGAAKVSGAGGRAAGAGLVLVLPPAGGNARVPREWKRLPCRLHARGLIEDVAA